MSKKANKQDSTERILSLGTIQPCIKLTMENIVFPAWDTQSILGQMFRQMIRTKEQPEGCLYDETEYQIVLRVIDGKVFMNNLLDSYSWKIKKVQSANTRPIGTISADALLTLTDFLPTVLDPDERKMLADMFVGLNKNLSLITTPEENRQCILITPELYEQGVTYCVDDWMEVDDEGNASTTELNPGDVLIVSSDGVYCIRRDTFYKTHALVSLE